MLILPKYTIFRKKNLVETVFFFFFKLLSVHFSSTGLFGFRNLFNENFVFSPSSDGLGGVVAPPFSAATSSPLSSQLSAPALAIEIGVAEQTNSNFSLSI